MDEENKDRKYLYDYGKDLPKDSYACLVGSYAYTSPAGIHYVPINAHHAYLWVENPITGLLYECAVHTRLTINSDVEICFFREPCPVDQWPEFGISQTQPRLSYRQLGLDQKLFSPIGERAIAEQLNALGARCDRIQVYGFGHVNGDGLHNIHLNSGEPEKVVTRKSYINQDGALVFYFADSPGLPAHRLWVCMKFEAQSIEHAIHIEGDENEEDKKKREQAHEDDDDDDDSPEKGEPNKAEAPERVEAEGHQSAPEQGRLPFKA